MRRLNAYGLSETARYNEMCNHLTGRYIPMKLPDFLIRDADGFIHVEGHRIGLQHLVRYYNEGYSPEMLACEYPTLSLPLIHKVLAYYLEHHTDVDQYVAENEAEISQQRISAETGPSVAELRERMRATAGAERP